MACELGDDSTSLIFGSWNVSQSCTRIKIIRTSRWLNFIVTLAQTSHMQSTFFIVLSWAWTSFQDWHTLLHNIAHAQSARNAKHHCYSIYSCINLMVRQVSVTVHIHKRIQFFSSWLTTSCRHWGRSSWCRVQRSPWWRGVIPTSAGTRLLPPCHSYLSITTIMKLVIFPIYYYTIIYIYSTWPGLRL